MVDIAAIGRFCKKHVSWSDILIAAAIILLYLCSRIIRLDSFPIFTDEGIYIRWAKVAGADPNWRFISLTDGKQPLHTWGMIPFLKVFSDNLLLGGRSFSVLSGFVALCGMFATCTYLYGKKYAGYVGALLYTITPMFLFYDRLALADSAVNAGALWMLFGSLLLMRTLRLDVALSLGLGAGIVLLTKSSSQLFLGLSALAPLTQLYKKESRWKVRAATYYLLLVVVGVIAFVIYNVQRLSPYLYLVAEKNKTFVLTFGEFISNPFALFWGNIHLIPWYVSAEMGYVLAFFGIAGLYMYAKKDWQHALYVCLWILLPYLAITSFAKVLFPRYVLYLAGFLIVGATYWFVQAKRTTALVSAAVVLLSVGYMNYTIVFSQSQIPFPPVDRGQYIESFNAGWGVKDMIAYARERSAHDGKPVKIIAEGNFGVIGDMLEASINRDDTTLSVSGYWPLGEEQLKAEQAALADHTVLVVFSHRQRPEDIPGIWPIKFLKEYKKPGGQDPFLLYELTP